LNPLKQYIFDFFSYHKEQDIFCLNLKESNKYVLKYLKIRFEKKVTWLLAAGTAMAIMAAEEDSE
jgi:hypothetical protein